MEDEMFCKVVFPKYLFIFLALFIICSLYSNKVNAQGIENDNPSTVYNVIAGDTLWDISQRFGIDLEILILSNNIDNPNLIYPGQELKIPFQDKIPQSLKFKDKLIFIDISSQRLIAYENGELIREFLVSTGTSLHPTVLGKFSIWIKLESTRMKGEGYDLLNVPWTMYFYRGYGIHGTYWHNNFGHPMSHGCINMKTIDAKWLYEWTDVGTQVEIVE